MASNERSSARVAKIAARIMAAKIPAKMNATFIVESRKRGRVHVSITAISSDDLNALAASVLTQAADRDIVASMALPPKIIKAEKARLRNLKPKAKARNPTGTAASAHTITNVWPKPKARKK